VWKRDPRAEDGLRLEELQAQHRRAIREIALFMLALVLLGGGLLLVVARMAPLQAPALQLAAGILLAALLPLLGELLEQRERIEALRLLDTHRTELPPGEEAGRDAARLSRILWRLYGAGAPIRELGP